MRAGAPRLRSELERGVGVVRRAFELHRARLDLLARGQAEPPQQALHISAEAVVLDLESVPRRVFPLDAVADIGMGARFERSEPVRALRIVLLRLDEGGDQPSLVVCDLPNAALCRLEQSGHEEIVKVAV